MERLGLNWSHQNSLGGEEHYEIERRQIQERCGDTGHEMRTWVWSIISLYFIAFINCAFGAASHYKDFPAVTHLLISMENALLVCLQSEELAVLGKAFNDLAPSEERERLVSNVSAQAQKCALDARVDFQPMYRHAAKELERNPPALAKLKDAFSVLIAVLTAIPRLQISYLLIGKEQQRDKELFREKLMEFSALMPQ